MKRALMLASALFGLTACGSPQNETPSAPTSAETSPAVAVPMDSTAAQAPAPQPSLPPVDTAAIAARVPPGTTVQTVDFAAEGETSVSGEVDGYTAPVYAVPIRAGQTLKVVFKPSNTNLYMNVLDISTSGAAAHRGDIDGEEASLRAVQDTVYVIQPYQVRATARRGETGSYSLNISRTAG